MPEKIDLNVSPYYDDYDESKKYHKVLYRASRPLQARELTQSQSIMQNQIERFGDHMFEEGSIVNGALANIDMDVYYVKVENTNPNAGGTAGVENYRTSFDTKYLKGATSGVVGKVVTSYAQTTDDPITYIVKYFQGGTDANNSTAFTAGETLDEVTVNASGVTASTSNLNQLQVQATSKTPNGRSSIADISEGTVFVRGFFVKVDKQQLILEKYSGKPSYRVGLEVAETLVSSASDSTLLDNSQGTSNENASGADRLKVSLTFAKHLLTSTTDSNFVELMRVNEGIMELKINKPMYNAFEGLMARRTFDTSGDFVVRQFLPNLKEHLNDGTNGGFYSALNGGVEDKFIMQVSPGKAYVKGYEIDKTVTSTVSFPKARTTETLAGASTPVRMGNYLKVKNAHGIPEFGNEAGSDAQAPYNVVKLYDAVIGTAGAENASGHIGYARIRNFDLGSSGGVSSNVYADTTEWNTYLFDIKMFTKLTYSAHSGSAVVGDKVTGSVSGATGIVAYDNNSDGLFVHDVVGTFTSSDAIASTNGSFAMTAAQNTGVNYRGTAGEIRNYNIDRVRGISQTPKTTAREKFTGDVIADSDQILTGTCTIASTALTGFGTKFTAELKEGDIIIDGGGTERVVASITNDLTAVIAAGTAASNFNCTRRRVKVYNQSQTASIYAWPRDWVSSHTPDQVQVRRSANVTIVSGNKFSLTSGSAETFSARNTDNFSITVVEEASSSPVLRNGDMVDITTLTESLSAPTLEISGFNANDQGAILKVTYTVDINTPVNRDKVLKQARCLSVVNSRTTGGFYGTCFDDKEISLGVADCYKVRAVYEGDGTNAPLPPSATITETASPAVAFQNFEVIKGNTSDALAVIVNYNGSTNLSYFYYTKGTFTQGETIVGQTSQATGTVTNVMVGATNITNRYYFDDGQRDGFYDHGRLTLKPGTPSPNAQILVLFDFFQASGAGDFFDVDSYATIPYKDIPKYIPSKVDLGGLEPDGEFELSDSVDFRPILGQLLGTTTIGSAAPNPASPINLSNTTSGCVSSPFSYTNKSFESSVTGISATNASAVDVPVNQSNVVGDITFYSGRIDKMFLHKGGTFQVATGTPSLTPTKPKGVEDAIELFELRIPAYTNDLSKVRVRSVDHRRFTMKDIGKISNRVANLERLTTLSLLERDTQTMQLQDADGFDRYKSGFVVDSFKGHNVGDVTHADYNCSIDTKLGVLRPKNFQNFFDIELDTVNSSNYTKTGDLITLPFSQISYVNQDKASRAINVNPYNVFAFIGNVNLSPPTDVWQDQTQLPEVRINREGNFDALLAESGDLGTVWNAWQTTWAGEPTTVSTEVLSTSSGSWSGDPGQGGEWVSGTEVSREITNTIETQSRTGIKTTVVEDFVEDRNDRVVSISVIPWIRAQTIEIDGTNLKPGCNHYVYFDNVDVNAYVRPYDANYSQDGGVTVASGIKADGNGRVRAYFDLPNSGVNRFPTGQRDLKLTSSYYNLSDAASNGRTTFSAQGLLQTNQTEIVSTRNGRVVTERLSGERDFSRRGEQINMQDFDTEGVWPEEPAEIPVQVPAVVPPPAAQAPIPIPAPPEPLPVPMPRTDGMFLLDFEGRWQIEPEIRGGWADPLAQSILCEASGGMMLTSVDLFFKTKDDNLPVNVEVRNMVNGYPGQMILPFSEVSKNPADVNTSVDGSVATTFTFPSPVFIEEGTEFCFVVLTNSDTYEAFISRMGETDLVTSQTIAGQPYAGSLFMSQNASTWTAEQTDDLKFNLRIANFDTSKIPVVKFDNKALPVATLQENPIESFATTNYVRVYSYSHGMYDTSSNTVIAGVVGDKTGAVTNIEAEGSFTTSGTMGATSTGVATTTGGSGSGCTVDITVASGSITSCKIANPGFGYADTDTLTVTNFGSATNSVVIDIDTVGDTIGGIPVSCINGTYTAIANIDIDSYTVIPDLSTTDLKTGYTATDSTISGGENVTAQRNYYFDAIHTMIPSLQLKNTYLHANVRTTAMKSPEGVGGTSYSKTNTAQYITLNDNHYLDQPAIIASPLNQTNEMSSVNSFTATLQLQSLNNNVSPVIDVASIGCLGIMNRLNNIDSSSDVPTGLTYVASTEPDGDNNAMVYMTRKVSLATPGTAIRVMLDGFRPVNSELKVMYKTLKNDESTPFDDLGWEYFNTTGAPDTSIETDARNFKEYNFTVDGLPEFTAFAIKIVGQSTSTSSIPLVSNLRAIALAT